MLEQRSDEWFEMRRGRFTAYDIVRLLGKEGLKTTTQSIDTYAFEKAVEIVFGLDEEEDTFVSKDMLRGIELEPLAFEKFKYLKALEFINVEKCVFFPYGDNAGASPDGLVGEDAILEIKCPKRNKFLRYVANGAEEIDSKYYAQMQMQMLCTNSNKCHFLNYIIHNGNEYWNEIIVNRDEEIIELLKQRIKFATKIKDEYVEKLVKNINF